MARLLIIIMWGLFAASCAHRWVAVPQNIPDFEKCEALKSGPQMLKVPGFQKSYIIVHDCSVMNVERVSIAMHTFIQKWKEKFPHRHMENRKVEKSLDSLISEFNGQQKNANAYTVDGTYGTNLSLSGLTLSPGWIWVKAFPDDRLCQSSFVHELAHVGIWSLKGTDGDPDHLGRKHGGWEITHSLIIQETNEILCKWGI